MKKNIGGKSLQRILHASKLQRYLTRKPWRSISKKHATTVVIVFFIIFFLGTLLFADWFDSVWIFRRVNFQRSTSTITTKIPQKCVITDNLSTTCASIYPVAKHNHTSHDQYPSNNNNNNNNNNNTTCPSYFRWIHEDLRPWEKTGITRKMIERGRRKSHFRLVIVDGKAYVEQYRQSIQTRDIFTLWGILQLLRWYPGKLPDLELMFNCDDRPIVRSKNFWGQVSDAPPLFRYSSDWQSLDIVFPDWSFWGWAETNLRPWKKVLNDIKEGNQRTEWKNRIPYAYWRGNPYVAPGRKDLLKCNVSDQIDWKTRLYVQNWEQESKEGYKNSNLGDQCIHRYKIYIEGWSWSASEKYILACDSMALYIKPRFYDFFIRGMLPLQHYWPIRDDNKCTSLKFAVDWGNNHTEEAETIGRAGANFMHEQVKMEYVYDYMFHLLNEYAKLLKFKPKIPPRGVELCPETMTCAASGDTAHRKFMIESMVMSPSESSPCTIPPPYSHLALQELIDRNIKSTEKVRLWEYKYWANHKIN